MDSIKKAEVILISVALILTALIVVFIIFSSSNVSPVSITYNTTINKTAQDSNLININEADEFELQQINGIGPKLAENIIDYRNKNGSFTDFSDLLKVKGIGDKKLEDIKNYICFE